MSAYDSIIKLLIEYFSSLGYNDNFLVEYFSPNIFKELISIRLANANVVIKNKTVTKSHQTHIAVTGEAIDFFYKPEDFRRKKPDQIDFKDIFVSKINLAHLQGKEFSIKNTKEIEVLVGVVTIGARTQNQVQLSKKNSQNSPCFNELRKGLFENDLLILLKERATNKIFAIGIPKTYYLDVIPNYSDKYETNTYLKLAKKST